MQPSVFVGVAVAALSALASRASAEPAVTCRLAAPTTTLTWSFSEEPSLRDLATTVAGFTCKNVVFPAEAGQYATLISALTPRPLTPSQALELFVATIEAAGLVVVQKPDTIVIKFGPHGPPRAPRLVGAHRPAPPAPPTPTAAGAELPPAPTDAEIAAGTLLVDDTHCEVSRWLVDAIRANPMALDKGARVVPAMAAGKPVGFRLYAVRPTGLLAQLGFKNRDTVTAVNGRSLATMNDALEAYASLTDQVTVTLLRNDKPMTLTITVH